MIAASTLIPAAPAVAAPTVDADRTLMVDVPGGRIFVRVNGDLDGPLPPVLMIHGGPGSGHSVFLPALSLAQDRAIILYDQLDCGLSDRPGDPANWTVPRFVAEVDAIRTALGLERLHILGHSWGGTIVLEYAAQKPKGLASLVLQGPLISTPVWLEDAAALRSTLPDDVQEVLRQCDGETPPESAICQAAEDVFYDRFWRLKPSPAYLDAYAEANKQQLNRALYETMWGRSELASTGTLKSYDGEPLLAQIDAPTLFLIGASDEVLPATAERFARQMRSGEVQIIADAAHRIQTDATAAYNDALRGWFAQQDAA